jgi:hypothetical protein
VPPVSMSPVITACPRSSSGLSIVARTLSSVTILSMTIPSVIILSVIILAMIILAMTSSSILCARRSLDSLHCFASIA